METIVLPRRIMDMIKKKPSGLSSAEKIFGIIIMFIGVALTYYTYLNLDVAGMASGCFIAFGVCLTVLGIILLILKTR